MLSITSRSTSAVDLSGLSVTTSAFRPTWSVPPVLTLPPVPLVPLLLPPQPARARARVIAAPSTARGARQPRRTAARARTEDGNECDGEWITWNLLDPGAGPIPSRSPSLPLTCGRG